MDILVKNAHMVNIIQALEPIQTQDVSMLQDVIPETKFLDSEILKAATDAEPVLLHKFQDQIDLNATDHNQLVDAHRD